MGSPAEITLFASLAFRGWFPVWLAVVLAVVAVAGVVLLYVSEARRVPTTVRIVLGTLRALLLVGILFLLLRPTWLTESREDRRREVHLLLDDSLSMTQADSRTSLPDRWRLAIALDLVAPNAPVPTDATSASLPAGIPTGGTDSPWPTRNDQARRILANPRLKLLETIDRAGPVAISSFGGSKFDKRNANWLEQYKAQQDRTPLADTVSGLLNPEKDNLPAAVFLVTDGRENASNISLEQLARQCQTVKVPLHIYGVGSSSVGQLQLRDVQVQDTLFVDDTAAIPVRYRARGFSDGKVKIVAKLNGEEIASKTVDVKDGEDLREVLTFVPLAKNEQVGKQDLTTSITVTSGNDSYTDEITRGVTITKNKLKVLFIDSNPRWDFKFIQRGLMRDRRVDARFFLTEGDKQAMKSGYPFLPEFPASAKDLANYDLIILGDFPAASLTREQQSWIRDFVAKDGGGLIHIAGRGYGPSSFLDTPLAELLPVEFEKRTFKIDPGVRQQGFRPDLTATGRRSSLLLLDESPEKSLGIWKTLPELYWHYPVLKTKPAAEIHLTHPTAKTTDEKPMPLLVSHYYGTGLVLFSAIDETWRWRFNEADKYFYRFWSQAIYLTGVPRTQGTRRTQMSLDTPEAILGQTGRVYARLLREDRTPRTEEKIEANLVRLDVAADDKDRSTKVELRARPNRPGEYIVTMPFNQVGRYSLQVDNGEKELAVLEYRVSLPPGHERAPGALAEEDMIRLAESTGGKFYREEELHTVNQHLKTQTAPIIQREETLLWNRWAFFAILALFVLEWFVRKFNSMS